MTTSMVMTSMVTYMMVMMTSMNWHRHYWSCNCPTDNPVVTMVSMSMYRKSRGCDRNSNSNSSMVKVTM